ncbi:glycosyltransferase family 4 protein [Aridibaculum aurantiacum]|uniref:glycosyltransferase family 4 protein n=1 Tax=Aridibaculum aurantiacum TaxID=2810307 RepID=UPI001A977C06|nr:glycosyltransferase family 4 protein [Aridibaculum aurantiacum]
MSLASSTKRNIYLVIPQFKTGGGNRVFVELANVLAEEHSVTIIFPNNTEDSHTFFVSPKIKIQPIGAIALTKSKKLINLFQCIRYINRHCKDGNVIITDPFMCLLGFMIKVPRLYRFVQADDYRIFDDKMILKNDLMLATYKRLCERSYRFRMNYIFNSSYTYQRFIEVSKTSVPYLLVHPALNHDVFNNRNRIPAGTNAKINIALIARKHPWKGFTTFLEVWKQLDEEVKQSINKVSLISHDDLSSFPVEQFQLVKPQSDHEIADVMRQSDIFISTSWWEGFGLPPLEAMACGCAVITSKSGGVDEYARDDKNCLMYEPKNVEQLKQAIERLLKNRHEIYCIANEGVESSKQFSWTNSARQLLEIIQ